jgi:Mg2+ and Co2+ transporter CorA
MLSGIFGMNFSVIPLAGYDWGFWAMIAVMVISVVFGIEYLRKRNMWR